MKLRIFGPLAIAAFAAAWVFGSARALAQNAYITNVLDNSVSVVNTATNTVTATIPVGAVPTGVAVTPDGSKVYVTNFESNSVSVIDTASNMVIDTIASVGPSRPVGVAVTPDGGRVYVTDQGFQPTDATVSVINTATNTVIAMIPVGIEPSGVAVTPDSSKVYVVNTRDNTVSAIATATDSVIATIPVGSNPVAFGVFIQPRFAGTPGKANCFGQSVAALISQFGGLNAAAAALGFSSITALERALSAFCEG
jgi:YVTN family beta-propeller protein